MADDEPRDPAAAGDGVRTPDESRRRGLPVVLIINGIHAGEVEGKEASLMLMRDLLDGAHGDLLAALTLVVVPLPSRWSEVTSITRVVGSTRSTLARSLVTEHHHKRLVRSAPLRTR